MIILLVSSVIKSNPSLSGGIFVIRSVMGSRDPRQIKKKIENQQQYVMKGATLSNPVAYIMGLIVRKAGENVL